MEERSAVSETCPHCGVRLDYEVDGQTYSRVVGVEVSPIYDGVLFWRCPECGGYWHRFPAEDFRRDSANQYAELHGLAFLDVMPMAVSEVGPGQFRRSDIEVRYT